MHRQSTPIVRKVFLSRHEKRLVQMGSGCRDDTRSALRARRGAPESVRTWRDGEEGQVSSRRPFFSGLDSETCRYLETMLGQQKEYDSATRTGPRWNRLTRR